MVNLSKASDIRSSFERKVATTYDSRPQRGHQPAEPSHPKGGPRLLCGTVRGVGLDVGMTVLDLARRLPGIAEMREHCQALATLEAVISPD
jgi:hypothetical protein